MSTGSRIVGLVSVLGAVGSIFAASNAWGGTVSFSVSQGERAASVQFHHVGTTLSVTLSNTSAFDVDDASCVLTAVFFDIAGSPDMAPVSAHLGAGATVINNAMGLHGTDVGGEWAFKGGLSTGPMNASYGISAAAFGLFGPGDVFGTSTWSGAESSGDELRLGITSASDDGSDNDGAARGPLVNHSVVFTFDVESTFDVNDIGNVSFQYGTGFDDPLLVVVPFPPALGLGLAGFGLVAISRRRMQRWLSRS